MPRPSDLPVAVSTLQGLSMILEPSRSSKKDNRRNDLVLPNINNNTVARTHSIATSGHKTSPSWQAQARPLQPSSCWSEKSGTFLFKSKSLQYCHYGAVGSHGKGAGGLSHTMLAKFIVDAEAHDMECFQYSTHSVCLMHTQCCHLVLCLAKFAPLILCCLFHLRALFWNWYKSPNTSCECAYESSSIEQFYANHILRLRYVYFQLSSSRFLLSHESKKLLVRK